MSQARGDIVIIGGGPAGMSAALWLRQFGFSPVIVDRNARLGGALLNNPYDNPSVLGFEHCTSALLGERFETHIRHLGIRTELSRTVEHITLAAGSVEVHLDSPEPIRGVALVVTTGIVAAGGEPLADIPGLAEAERLSKISYAHPTPEEIRSLSGARTAILGGGDNAFEVALNLAKAGCRPTLILRGHEARAQKHYQAEAAAMEASGTLTVIRGIQIKSIRAIHEGVSILLADGRSVESNRAYALLGYLAKTGWLVRQLPALAVNARGFITVDEGMHTSLPEIYAAGDIVSPHNLSVVSALSTGSMAARSIEKDI